MIHWITPRIGTGSYDQAKTVFDAQLIDVRDLVDKAGNTTDAVKSKIDHALAFLKKGNKVILCCDHGMSRSNAVAAGVLASYEKISLDHSLKRILQATGEKNIKIEVLSVLRRLLDTKEENMSPDTPRVLVTGSSGFIGAGLIPQLNQRFSYVCTPKHHDTDLMRDTVALHILVNEYSITDILHLANPRMYTTSEAMGTSLVMLKNVLDVCAQTQLRLIYLSSWEIYSGYKTRELRADERTAPYPGGTYGQTKMLCEFLIDQYRRNFNVPSLIIRSSPVYGIESDRPKFIWNFLGKARAGEDIITHEYINGFPALDLIHVGDLRRAITSAVACDFQGTLNVGTGILTSTAEIARLIVDQLKSNSTIKHVKIDSFTGNIAMDTRKAEISLKWKPKVELNEGLKSIIESGVNNESE